MRILIVSDLHYSLRQFDWLVAQTDGHDLIVIAGDLLDVAGHADLDTQILVVEKYLTKLREKVPVIVCSGNHDGDKKNSAGEYICEWLKKARRDNLHVDGDSLHLNGDLISVCPWWDGPVTRQEMVAFLDSEQAKPRRRWLWVHHAPPTETPVSWTGSKDAGDSFFLECLGKYKPDLAFSGHIHNSPFAEGGRWVDRVGSTWVFNAGRQMAPLPASIVVDLERMTAQWESVTGVETVDLMLDLDFKAR
ncbi:MAG: hypothetical protein GHCLOJNM_01325 [bacterium]|nr:hypothetical protein [bacterium]